MTTSEFNLSKHARAYQYDYMTVIDNVMPSTLCDVLRCRINKIIEDGKVAWVSHEGKGNADVSDAGGRYLHHIFQGDDVREHLPELTTLYHAVLPLVTAITNQDVVVSPHRRSDVNIKVYPAGGGTLGEHYDSNGITALLFLTSNKEAPLRVQLPRAHPSKQNPWVERRNVYATAGSLLLMKDREVLHDCEPTVTEQKITAVLNFYTRDDTWRHERFDAFVYEGANPAGTTYAD
ncbi:hypothetical protein [Pinirhizobacter sp.]|jgi:hypothetical protein|uniref:hypothetical protein n=1 Tax=Pinirhizobacter sp. TaxID=2950432 RepID=UPI002F3F555E